MSKQNISLAAVCALAVSQIAQASDINVNGFLSVGVSMLDENNVSINDADSTGGFRNDATLGLQLSKKLNATTSVTGQLVSRGNEDYKTEAAWAFVTYTANDHTDLRMGRLRVPGFYYSDFLEVGYAYNWIRPPGEVYRIPFSSVDGVDISHRYSLGTLDGTIQLYYGRYQGNLLFNDTAYVTDARNLAGIVLSNSYGDFGTRLSLHRSELHLESTPGSDLANASAAASAIAQTPAGVNVAQALQLSGTDANDIPAAFNTLSGVGDASAADDFVATGQVSSFYEAAFYYDDDNIHLIAEWTALDNKFAGIPDDQAWLVSTAKRVGDYTPHLTYSYSKNKNDSGAVGAIQTQLGVESEQSSITFGVRYDYDTSTALKVEIQYNDEKTTNGQDGESATLYSIALDLVF